MPVSGGDAEQVTRDRRRGRTRIEGRAPLLHTGAPRAEQPVADAGQWPPTEVTGRGQLAGLSGSRRGIFVVQTVQEAMGAPCGGFRVASGSWNQKSSFGCNSSTSRARSRQSWRTSPVLLRWALPYHRTAKKFCTRVDSASSKSHEGRAFPLAIKASTSHGRSDPRPPLGP